LHSFLLISWYWLRIPKTACGGKAPARPEAQHSTHENSLVPGISVTASSPHRGQVRLVIIYLKEPPSWGSVTSHTSVPGFQSMGALQDMQWLPGAVTDANAGKWPKILQPSLVHQSHFIFYPFFSFALRNS
jgi:hypothetical protein